MTALRIAFGNEEFVFFTQEGDSQNKIKIPVPFTTEELVNLKRGVCEHGEDWEAILDRYSFDATRTPLQLKVKWETVVSQQ